MKLRKILAAALAAAAMCASAVTVFAAGDGEAAYCFDTPSKLSDWETYGAADQTGLSITHITSRAKNGDGCIAVSEKSTGEVTETFGGAYITADKLGLNDFSGCTVSMSVLVNESAAAYIDNFSLFSDGIIWVEAPAAEVGSKEWTEIAIDIPADAENPRVGFTIPTFKAYSGEIIYIDDFSVTRADGTVVANTGDYKMKTVSKAETVSKGMNIVLIIVLVVLILAIVGGIALFISKSVKRFV